MASRFAQVGEEEIPQIISDRVYRVFVNCNLLIIEIHLYLFTDFLFIKIVSS